MLPMLGRKIVNKRSWATMEEMVGCFAIGQCAPGVIAVNAATFAGYRRRGVERDRQSPLINTSFLALRPVVTGLIAAATYGILKLVLIPASGQDRGLRGRLYMYHPATDYAVE